MWQQQMGAIAKRVFHVCDKKGTVACLFGFNPGWGWLVIGVVSFCDETPT